MGDDVTNLLRKVAAAPRLVPPAMRGTHRFDFGRRLGSGTFGEVFVARDREHGGAVALKVLRRHDPEWVYRFKREFRHVADVSHANIARLYELFEESGSWFLTMELVDGIAFDEHLARLPEQLESCFSQLASGIRALHSAGVLHRDIKPSNALVEATGRVVLLDFGLAYGLSSSDQQILAGTPLFMAPEQWTGDLGEGTDWYAFGAMLYSALAETSPFEARGESLLASKLKGPKPFTPPPGREGLAELAMRLLHPNAAERPGHREIAAAFPVAAMPEVRAADRLPFVGRKSELARMRAATENPRGTAWLHVTGEPGIGKTALVRAFLDEAKLGGAAVYGGRCHETESTPFKGLDGAVDMLASELSGRDDAQVTLLLPDDIEALSEMFPVLKRVARLGARQSGDRRWFPHARRLAAFDALRSLLSKIADDRRVFLFIDDIQWAGEDTLLLLHAILDPPPPGLFVFTTMRSGAHFPESVSKGLRDIDGVERVDLELAPLDRDEVGALLSERSDDGMDGEKAFRESGGHPYLLSRILTSGGAGGTLTADLRESISALSDGARRLLEVIALEALPLTQAAAFAAAGVDGFRADVVDELRRQRLARTSRVGPEALIEPYHDRVRETLLGMLSPDELRRGHESLAQYLESKRRASPHSLARHYQEAGNFDNARRWIRLAAGDAVRGLAFLRADELYRQAVHLSSGVDRVDLLLEWADAMVQSGRRAHAASIYLDASKSAEAEGYVDEARELRTRAGEHSILAGDFKQGIALLEASLQAAGIELPEGAAVINLAMEAAGALMQRGLDFEERPEHEISSDQLRNLDLLLTTTRALLLTDLRSTYLANLALSEALRLGEPRRVQRALSYFVIGNAGAAPKLPLFIDAVGRAYALAERHDDDGGRTWAVAADGIRHMQAGDLRKAWPLLRDAERRFWSLDPPMSREAGAMRVLILACAVVDGVDVPFAVRVVDNWIADAASRDDYFVTNWMRLVGSRVKLVAGDVAHATKQAAAARVAWSEIEDDLFAATIIQVEMGLRAYTEPDEAHVIGRELSRRLSSLFVSAAPFAKVGFQIFYGSALAAGSAAGTLAANDLVERSNALIADLSTHDYDAGAIATIRSHLALRDGDRHAAAEHMLRSAELSFESARVLHSVCARLRCAQLSRDEPEAAARLRELRDLGVGDPERYATLLAGPRPPP